MKRFMIFFFLLFSFFTYSQTYYVDVSGIDDSTRIDSGQPFATVNFALSMRKNSFASLTININGGTYSQPVEITNNVSGTYPIFIQATNSDKPIFQTILE